MEKGAVMKYGGGTGGRGHGGGGYGAGGRVCVCSIMMTCCSKREVTLS